MFDLIVFAIAVAVVALGVSGALMLVVEAIVMVARR